MPKSMGSSNLRSMLDSGKSGIAVPALPLHRMLPEWLEHIDFLKIDTQGFT